VPAKTLKEFVALARSRPGMLNFGSGGTGTTTHVGAELLKSVTKIDIVHIPYKGTGLALIGLMGGQIDMLVMAVAACAPQINAGRVRALAVLSEKRASVVPNVPTSREAGINNIEVPLWYGILAPAATPREIITRLNTEFTKALTSSDVREKFAGAGLEPATSTPEQFAAWIKSETVRYGKVIKDAGIKAE
jgi:tripartite-type tricarboxylate transporter receptor subunit TctC